VVLWMRRDTLHKCLRTWYWNAAVLRRVRHAVCRMRRVLTAKALRSWYLWAGVLRGIRDFVLYKAEGIVTSAFGVWCENVAERRRHRHRLASSRLWSARRRSRSC
jgi:hypothetical protein